VSLVVGLIEDEMRYAPLAWLAGASLSMGVLTGIGGDISKNEGERLLIHNELQVRPYPLYRPYKRNVAATDIRIERAQDDRTSREEIANILTNYYVIPRDQWISSYHHVNLAPVEPSHIVMREREQLRVERRPGGLAVLILSDGTVVHLARELHPFVKRKKATTGKTSPTSASTLSPSAVPASSRPP